MMLNMSESANHDSRRDPEGVITAARRGLRTACADYTDMEHSRREQTRLLSTKGHRSVLLVKCV